MACELCLVDEWECGFYLRILPPAVVGWPELDRIQSSSTHPTFSRTVRSTSTCTRSSSGTDFLPPLHHSMIQTLPVGSITFLDHSLVVHLNGKGFRRLDRPLAGERGAAIIGRPPDFLPESPTRSPRQCVSTGRELEKVPVPWFSAISRFRRKQESKWKVVALWAMEWDKRSRTPEERFKVTVPAI